MFGSNRLDKTTVAPNASSGEVIVAAALCMH